MDFYCTLSRNVCTQDGMAQLFFFMPEVSLHHVNMSKIGIKLLGTSADPAAGKNCHHQTRIFVS